MVIYAVLNKSEMTIDLTENAVVPDGYIKMKTKRPLCEWHARSDGEWYPGDPEKETLFIENEMQLVAEQLLMHEDGDDNAISTTQEWREYRKALRCWNWPGNEYFPDPQYRPKRPNV